MTEIKIQEYRTATDEMINAIDQMEQVIFPTPLSKERIIEGLRGKVDMVGLIAVDGERLCGFKIGFQRSPDTFYSWIGGVTPDYRQRGIAKSLMTRQHEIAKELGYKYIRTSTKNKYREMLVLNIRSGFDIVGVERKLKESELSILLEKEI